MTINDFGYFFSSNYKISDILGTKAVWKLKWKTGIHKKKKTKIK